MVSRDEEQGGRNEARGLAPPFFGRLLYTPRAEDLSAGIVCFEVEGLSPEQVVTRLHERGIVASVTPYATRYARLAPSLLTAPEEVDTTLRAVGDLGKAAA